jgi:hypothetical protein
MNMAYFQKLVNQGMNMKYAKPVFIAGVKNDCSSFAAFRCDFHLKEAALLEFHLAARSFYRLYINNELCLHGPARTGHGRLRVDEYAYQVPAGLVQVAVEVAAYDTTDHYSNDITTEDGLLMAEIWAENSLISATGGGEGAPWLCSALDYRESRTEVMSHCREIIEVYSLREGFDAWRTGRTEGWKTPVAVDAAPLLLERHAPLPEMQYLPIDRLIQAVDILPGNRSEKSTVVDLRPFFQKQWYQNLKEFPTHTVVRDGESAFSGKIRYGKDGSILVKPAEGTQFALMWEARRLAVGFLCLDIEIEEDTTIDLLHSDVLEPDGSLHNAMTLVRYTLAAGKYHLVTFEPYFVRYLKVVVRGGGCKMAAPELLTYWRAERQTGAFVCSKPELNVLFEAARLTLQANTLDIFMDCPERERGGWACDSLWTARAAFLMTGDLGVERDFLENFLLAPVDKFKPYGFFPGAYPSNPSPTSVTITTWSFWLLLQLCEYYRRSGDRDFVEQHRGRVEQFVEGARRFIGPSGLLENMPKIFIDCSQSNQTENFTPISIPANALFAHTLCKLGELYGEPKWEQFGNVILDKLRGIQTMSSPFMGAIPDSFEYKDGAFSPKNCYSEGAVFIDIWTGLYNTGNNPLFIEKAVRAMGSDPIDTPEIMFGRAQLFIGLIIRFDMLARLGEYDTLLRELQSLYLPQILEGPGTMYEYIEKGSSNCHGMNSHAAVHLIRDFLGLGVPERLTHTLRISPHPCGLAWAQGSVDCDGHPAFLRWQVQEKAKKFEMHLSIPDDWKAEVKIPDEFTGWNVEFYQNGKKSPN